MGREVALLDRPTLCRALETMLDYAALASVAVEYRLIGTAAALLHGVTLPAGDVDILLKRREDVDAFSAALSRCTCLVAPVWLPGSHQYFARYDVDGVEVEFSTVEWETTSDLSEAVGPGPWRHYVELCCGRHTVPTVALELRLLTELLRDRADRYRPLSAHLAAHGYDLDLVRRGLAAMDLSADRREAVLRGLAAPTGGATP